MRPRIIRFASTLLLACGLAAPIAGAAPVRDGPADPAATSRALVVLVGRAGEGGALETVLSELLLRQGVTPEFARKDRFRARSFLAEGGGDARVWVFITLSGPHEARLYFRGPLGERFLLRRLSLKNGLDELGRELIAQVVETSAVALLRSQAGVSREEAKAGLAEDDMLDSPAEGDAAATDRAETMAADGDGHSTKSGGKRPLEASFALRGVASYLGSSFRLGHGAGVEAALGWHPSLGHLIRIRLAAEQSLGQSLEASGVFAKLSTTSLRGGAEVGLDSGMSAFVLSLQGGADLVQIAPYTTSNADLELASESKSIVPIIRLEARYELTVAAFRFGAGLFGDAALSDTHYDVSDAAGRHAVAEPLKFRPGLALTLGLRADL